MKKIEFVHARDVAFRKVADFAPQSFLETLSKDDQETEVRTHFAGAADRLFLMEIKEVPNAQTVLHAHEKDEIFFVLEGEMRFGQRTCVAGDSVHICGGTLYTFRAGPNGCRYLKFTGSADHSFIPKDHYSAEHFAASTCGQA